MPGVVMMVREKNKLRQGSLLKFVFINNLYFGNTAIFTYYISDINSMKKCGISSRCWASVTHLSKKLATFYLFICHVRETEGTISESLKFINPAYRILKRQEKLFFLAKISLTK